MTPRPRFETRDAVRILEGPFRGFTGTVTGLDAAGDRLTVAVPVFGRQVLLDLRRRQVGDIR